MINNEIIEPRNNFDVIIIGGGPAGLTSGIYAARDGLNVLLIEKISVGGQIFLSENVENYPGIEKISGADLTGIMEKQAKKFGVNFVFEDVIKVEEKDDKKVVYTTSSGIYSSTALIIATGTRHKELNIPGEAGFKGHGVSNCATCDAAFYKNLDVAVIGGGDTAVQEALFLTKFVNKVYLIHRRDSLRATKIIQEKAFKNAKIQFIFDTVADEIIGDKNVNALKIRNVKTNEIKILPVNGVFIFIGSVPNTDFVKDLIITDETGYIKTDIEMQTSRDGIFACGDCIKKNLRQVVTAAGEGAIAAYNARLYMEKIKNTKLR
ncbi:MAG TPA: thioredoxin-disulfide reductase [Candidatus Goldiibacteriota bacterium]|nr:thioredoxin-disulfide reductase [Candidatus Goldiibacteriota bacterium]